MPFHKKSDKYHKPDVTCISFLLTYQILPIASVTLIFLPISSILHLSPLYRVPSTEGIFLSILTNLYLIFKIK